MNDSFVQRVRSAAVAAWWTILIGGIWVTVSWLVNLAIISARPKWLLKLWGGEITWEQINSLMVIMMGVFKLMLFACVLAAIWLTLWGRRLKRAAAA